MRKYRFPFFVFAAFVFFFYGVLVGKYKIFPYQFIKMVKNAVVTVETSEDRRNGEERLQMFELFSPKADVAFIGDSITNGGEWAEFFPQLKVVNRGVSGDKVSDILVRLDSILTTQPKKAFIMVGINDINTGIPVDQILINYERLIGSLLDAKIKVYVQSTIQCALNVCGNAHVKEVKKLNQGLIELTKDKVFFVDLGSLSKDTGLEIRFTADGFHLTAKGYLYWVNRILPYLYSD